MARERSDVRRNREAILHAAADLFDHAADPTGVSMDDIAAAAEVGKGTVFRRFGDRWHLIRTIFDQRVGELVNAIETGESPLGPRTPPAQRITAIVQAIIAFKFENENLTRALEDADTRATTPRFEDTPHYQWAHRLLSGLFAEVGPAEHSRFSAHTALSLTRFDLLERLRHDADHNDAQLGLLIDTHLQRLTQPPPDAAHADRHVVSGDRG